MVRLTEPEGSVVRPNLTEPPSSADTDADSSVVHYPRPNEIKKHVLMPTFLRHIFYRDWLCKMNAVVKLKSKRIVHEYMRKRAIKPLTKVCQEGDLVIQHSRGSSRVALESNFFKIPWLLQE